MKTLVIFPPEALATMPYLAPYLLKGHVESKSHHRVDCLDLNVLYQKACWTGDIFQRFALNLDLPENFKRQMLELYEHGQDAYQALKDPNTYQSLARDEIKNKYAVIKRGVRLEKSISEHLGAGSDRLPTAYGQWSERVEKKAKGLACRFLDAYLEKIDLDQYHVIGFCCAYIDQLVFTKYLARKIKERNPSITTVIGGGAFTHLLDDFLQDLTFWQDLDYGIPFEGEYSFLELLNALEAGKTSDFQNIVYFKEDKYHYSKNLAIRPNISPIPDFSTLENHYPTPKPVYPLLTSKGCYWGKCAYCTHHEGYGQGYYQFKNDVLEDVLRHVVSLGGEHFYFVDEALPAAKIKHAAEVFKKFRQEGILKQVHWMSECRVEKYTTDRAFLELLKESGCRLLVSGMESGSQRVSNLMNKGVRLDLAREYAQLCKQVGIDTGWMFFIGFPGEKIEEAKQTFDLIEECKDYLTYAAVGTFALEKGSPIWNSPEKFGVQEILDRDRPYALGHNYIDVSGKTWTGTELSQALSVFNAYYFEKLEKQFTGVVDRAFALFFPQNIRSDVNARFYG